MFIVPISYVSHLFVFQLLSYPPTLNSNYFCTSVVLGCCPFLVKYFSIRYSSSLSLGTGSTSLSIT